MKLNFILAIAAGALTLAGCSTPAKVDSGAIRGSTFNFLNPGPKKMPGFADNTEPVHAMIQQAITRNLADHGVTKVDGGGDLTVAYLLVIGNNGSVMSINDYFGYREDIDQLTEKAHEAYTGSKNPNYFEAGTLLIDIIDSRDYKLLKRSHATRGMLQNPSAEARAARIQEVVNEIFQDLRVER